MGIYVVKTKGEALMVFSSSFQEDAESKSLSQSLTSVKYRKYSVLKDNIQLYIKFTWLSVDFLLLLSKPFSI